MQPSPANWLQTNLFQSNFCLETSSRKSVSPSTIPRISLIQGDCYDEDTLVSAFEGVDAVFVNTNGFAIGEKAEIFWGIRMYEIAYWSGVKHFIYSSLPAVSKKSGYNPKYRVPFVDGKAKVVGKKETPFGPTVFESCC